MSKKSRTRNARSHNNEKAASKKAEPPQLIVRSIRVEEFVRRLRAETNADKRFALFLGAGCSVSSGIPAAGALVRDRWIPQLHALRAPERKDVDVWVKEEIDGYDPGNAAASYGCLIDRLFLTADDRQREIEDLCDGRTPSFGYAVLAQLLARDGGRFNVVLTTNFDDLIADALYLYTEARPLVIHHQALAAYIRPTRTGPMVIKLHGDHRLSPRNTALETQDLAEEFQRHAAMVLHDRGIIFMGYGGADLGILKMLKALPVEALPFGAYWVHPEEPHGQVREWLSHRQGVWVRSGWFDEVMLLIRNEFGLSHPSPERFTRIFDEYQEKFQELSTLIQQKPGTAPELPALKKAITETEALLPDFWKPLSEATRVEDVDPIRAEEIYSEAVARFPTAAPLIGNYATFLYNNGKYDAAEEMFKRALEQNPKHPIRLGNYAMFRWKIRKDLDGAEAMLKEAVEADSKNATNYANYATFVWEARGDLDRAEGLYQHSLSLDPKQSLALNNYANFSWIAKRDYDLAESLYQRALMVDPKNPRVKWNFAEFLWVIKKDNSAAEDLYKTALSINPNLPSAVASYATFLWKAKGERGEAMAMYKKALKEQTSNAGHRLNLAGLSLANGDKTGLGILHELKDLSSGMTSSEQTELWFYLFAHGAADERIEALKRLRRLLESGARSLDWDLSENVDRARKDKHPDALWLQKLVETINNKIELKELSDWPAWNQAKDSGGPAISAKSK